MSPSQIGANHFVLAAGHQGSLCIYNNRVSATEFPTRMKLHKFACRASLPTEEDVEGRLAALSFAFASVGLSLTSFELAGEKDSAHFFVLFLTL